MALGKIALTGATGMLGRHIIAALQAANMTVLPVNRKTEENSSSCDLSRWPSTKHLDLLLGNVSALVHAAAVLPLPSSNEQLLFDVNVRACAGLARWAAMRSIPVVYISSGTVYKDPHAKLISENEKLGKNSLGGFYGMTKVMGEDIFNRFLQSNPGCAIIRPSSIYGSGGDTSKILYRFLQLAEKGIGIEVAPPSEDKIDFIHAADVASAIVLIIRKEAWGTYNVSSGKPTSIRELAEMCVDVTGRGAVSEAKSRSFRRLPAYNLCLNNSTARHHLGWRPQIGMREGLEMVMSNRLLPQNMATFIRTNNAK